MLPFHRPMYFLSVDDELSPVEKCIPFQRGFHAARLRPRPRGRRRRLFRDAWTTRASRTVEIFINRPIRLKKFDPVGGTRNEIRSTRNQFSGFVRLAIVMHPYEYSTAEGEEDRLWNGVRAGMRTSIDGKEVCPARIYACPPKNVPKNRSDFIDRTSSLFLFSFFRKLRPRQGIEAREKSSRIHFFRDLAFEVERNPIHATRNSIRHELALSCARISRAPR